MREDSQLNGYLVIACSLMLAVVLVVGAAGDAAIERLSTSATTTAKLAFLEQLNRQADRDRILTPAAITLAMIAVFLVAMAARSVGPRRSLIDTV
jgi:pheromone shutdown protein TraB